MGVIKPSLEQIADFLDPDLNTDICKAYEKTHGLTWKRPNFSRLPEGRYFARASVPLSYNCSTCGNATFLVMGAGNGTGNSEDYKRNEVTFSQDILVFGNVERFIPRLKEKRGVISEIGFPLLTFLDREIYPNVGHLNQLLLKDSETREVYVGGQIGLSEEDFSRLKTGLVSPSPGIWRTTGVDFKGKRFGDPHAIHNPTNSYQAWGFIALTSKENDALIQLLSKPDLMLPSYAPS